MIKIGYTTSDGVNTIHETTVSAPEADTIIQALQQSKATQDNILYFFLAYEYEGEDIQYAWLDPL